MEDVDAFVTANLSLVFTQMENSRAIFMWELSRGVSPILAVSLRAAVRGLDQALLATSEALAQAVTARGRAEFTSGQAVTAPDPDALPIDVSVKGG